MIWYGNFFPFFSYFGSLLDTAGFILTSFGSNKITWSSLQPDGLEKLSDTDNLFEAWTKRSIKMHLDWAAEIELSKYAAVVAETILPLLTTATFRLRKQTDRLAREWIGPLDVSGVTTWKRIERNKWRADIADIE